MYKITYDLMAIPAADYQIPITRQSRHNQQLSYRQIPTLKDYYKYTFFPRTIVHWNALPFYIPLLPTVAQFIHTVCQVVPVSPKISEVLLPFNYTNPSPSLCLLFFNFSPFLFNYTPTPLSPLYLCTELRLMSSTEVKTYRKKKKERLSCTPIAFWILLRTSSFVTWSL